MDQTSSNRKVYVVKKYGAFGMIVREMTPREVSWLLMRYHAIGVIVLFICAIVISVKMYSSQTIFGTGVCPFYINGFQWTNTSNETNLMPTHSVKSPCAAVHCSNAIIIFLIVLIPIACNISTRTWYVHLASEERKYRGKIIVLMYALLPTLFNIGLAIFISVGVNITCSTITTTNSWELKSPNQIPVPYKQIMTCEDISMDTYDLMKSIMTASWIMATLLCPIAVLLTIFEPLETEKKLIPFLRI